MKIFVLIFLLFNPFSSSQEEKCNDLIFYKIIWDEYKPNSKTLEFDFNYSLSDLEKEDLMNIQVFTEEQVRLIEKNLKSDNYKICDDIKREIHKVKNRVDLPDSKKYSLKVFSQPIHFSENEVCLFTYTISKNRKYEGGKAIGANQLIIFRKENGNWKISQRKILAWF